ncbi:MAG: glycosyltransferase [Nitrospirae bacterium]|nr:glycosyltransferase [Nitrospirota bacterium]
MRGIEKRQKSILWVRTDSIGDNILASSMLPEIKQRFSDYSITVLCQGHIAVLYEHCPEIDDVITFDRKAAYANEGYRNGLIERLKLLEADIALNSVYSREPLTDMFTTGSMAKEMIAFNGDFANGMTPQLRQSNNPLYTKIIYTCCQERPEMDRHREFLKGIGITLEASNPINIQRHVLKPLLWLDKEDEAFAARFFEDNGLTPQKTIALFPSAQHYHKRYNNYTQVLKHFKDYNCVVLGGKEVSDAARGLKEELPACHDLTGKTTLRQCAAIIARCRIYLGSDSSGAHMACAKDVANVVVLGGGHFGRFIPYSPFTTAVCLPLECYGCNWDCRYQAPYCVNDVSTEAIVQAMQLTLLGTLSRPRIVVDNTHIQDPDHFRPRWRWSNSYLISKDVEVIHSTVPANSSHRGREMLSSELPLVTVLVSTYKSEEFIRECLQDLENQTIAQSTEIVVVDAASTQNERAIVEEFQRLYTNITYVRTGTRISVYEAWNVAIKISKGRYITTFSTNDRLRNDAYEILASSLNDNPDCMLVYGDSYLTEVAHQTFEEHHCCDVYRWPEFCYEDLLRDCMIGPHPMWRRHVHNDIGYFDERYVSIGDQDFWLRMAERYKMLHIPEVTGLYWVSPDALSRKGQLPAQENLEIRLNHQQRYLKRLKQTVKVNTLFNKRPLYIWGTGQAGVETLNMLLNSAIQVDGFIDSALQRCNNKVMGLSVHSPALLLKLIQTNRRPFVVIASMYANQIKPFLLKNGFKHRQDFWTNIHTLWALKGLTTS